MLHKKLLILVVVVTQKVIKKDLTKDLIFVSI